MKITIDMPGVADLTAPLQAFPANLRRSLAVATTRTAGHVLDAEVAEMRDSFDRPTQRTLWGLYRQPATPDNLAHEVGIKGAGAQIPAERWLRPQVEGGGRALKPFERLLRSAGAMPDGMRAVPGKFARLDAWGNVSRGQIIQILSHLRIDTYRGSTRSLPRVNPQDNAASQRRAAGVIRRAYDRAGGRFIAFPEGRGKLLPGIYQVTQFAQGRSAPRPVLIFVDRVHYERRFDFYFTAELAVRRHFRVEVGRAVGETLQYLQRKGRL